MHLVQRVKVLDDPEALRAIVGNELAATLNLNADRQKSAGRILEAWIVLLAGCTLEFGDLVQEVQGAIDWSESSEIRRLKPETLAASISSPVA